MGAIEQQQQTSQELIQTPIQKRIDELAVTRTAAFERIAAALEKNNNRNIADAIYYLSESMMEMSRAIRALAAKDGAENEQQRYILDKQDQYLGTNAIDVFGKEIERICDYHKFSEHVKIRKCQS